MKVFVTNQPYMLYETVEVLPQRYRQAMVR